MPVLPVWLLAVTVGHSAEARTVGPWQVEMDPDLVVVTQHARPAWPGGGPILVLRCKVWDEKGKLIGKHHREPTSSREEASWPGSMASYGRCAPTRSR